MKLRFTPIFFDDFDALTPNRIAETGVSVVSAHSYNAHRVKAKLQSRFLQYFVIFDSETFKIF